MRMKLPAQRWISWLLLLAFLHAVLAPSMGLAAGRGAAAGSILVSLCGVDGDRVVEVELSDAGIDSSTAPATQHDGLCLLCFTPATPAQIGGGCPLSDVSRSVPTGIWDDPEPRFVRAWHPAHARAPPAAV